MFSQKKIFSSPAKAWSAVAVYTIFLYSTLTLAYDLYMRLYRQIGESSMSMLMGVLYVLLGLILFVFMFFYIPRKFITYAAFMLICFSAGFCLASLEVPAKRFHFLQYGVLTLLIFDAMRFRFSGYSLYVWTLAIVTLIGAGDEVLQGLLPKRTFAVVDIAENSTAGLLTLAFIGFVITEENYPYRRRRVKES